MKELELWPELSTIKNDTDLDDLIADPLNQNEDKLHEFKPLTSEKSLSSKSNEKPPSIEDKLNAFFELIYVIIGSNPCMVFNVLSATCIMLVAYLVINSHSIYHLDASIEHDYTGVTSIYDFTAGGIDHWCLDGSDVTRISKQHVAQVQVDFRFIIFLANLKLPV